MEILAIDSSGSPASAAVAADGVLLAEYTIRYKKTHSQTLLPMMDSIKRMIDLDLSEIDAVAVAGGPGSFTGLRIGSATAKGIGLALDKPLVHVPTLEAMAYNFYGSDQIIVPMLDARRAQVFAGIYTFECDNAGGAGAAARDPLHVIMDQAPVDVRQLCDKINHICDERGRGAVILGDGVSAYKDIIEENLRASHLCAPAHLNEQRAGSVAVRGMDLARMGKLESAADHRPQYLRVSQAERVRAQKESQK